MHGRAPRLCRIATFEYRPSFPVGGFQYNTLHNGGLPFCRARSSRTRRQLTVTAWRHLGGTAETCHHSILPRPIQSRSFSGILRCHSRHRLAVRAVEAFTGMQHSTSFRGVRRRRRCRRCAQEGDDFNDPSVADAGECLASRATELIRTSFQHILGRTGQARTRAIPLTEAGQ